MYNIELDPYKFCILLHRPTSFNQPLMYYQYKNKAN